ncbi:Uncharacterised protein [Shigella sonnei]|nr:Uncharacterised protein [Shigella sonnei]CST30185.1 Uncharacterised protein [Shigella sonnei]
MFSRLECCQHCFLENIVKDPIPVSDEIKGIRSSFFGQKGSQRGEILPTKKRSWRKKCNNSCFLFNHANS